MSLGEAKGGISRSLSLFLWVVTAAVLVAAAFLAGAGLARRWMLPAIALPVEPPSATQAPTQTPAAWLAPGTATESTLSGEGTDEWRFRGQAGQSATIEMWFHPGAGSSVEAELAVYLIGPDGNVLASETGSVFLTPYLNWPQLPTDGQYHVRVVPTSSAPGLYSLLLTLSEPSVSSTPGAPLSQQPRPTVATDPDIAFTPGMFQWPTTRRAISGWIFHDPGNPGHIGLDIAAAMWDPIVAAADGIVVFADWGGGYGNLVIVEHQDGWLTYYAHFSEIVVEVGQEVRQGEILGGAGTTGYSTGPHLHFEIRYQGRPVDPHIHLP